MLGWNNNASAILVLMSSMLVGVVRSDTNQLWCGRGMPRAVVELLQIKNFPVDGYESMPINWLLPSNIVVDATHYDVSTNYSDFRIIQSGNVIGKGVYEVYENYRDARIAALVCMTASSSLPLELQAERLFATCVSSNLVHFVGLDETNSCGDVFSVYKNVFLRLSGMSTNKYAIAEQLLIAGDHVP